MEARRIELAEALHDLAEQAGLTLLGLAAGNAAVAVRSGTVEVCSLGDHAWRGPSYQKITLTAESALMRLRGQAYNFDPTPHDLRARALSLAEEGLAVVSADNSRPLGDDAGATR